MGSENFRKRKEIEAEIEELDDSDIYLLALEGKSLLSLFDEVTQDEWCDICDTHKWVQIIFTQDAELIHICRNCYITGNWDHTLGLGDFFIF